MKKLELYQCDLCGTQYRSRLECKNCEKSHRRPTGVLDARWNAKNVGSSDGYPVKVSVMFDNGVSVDYRR